MCLRLTSTGARRALRYSCRLSGIRISILILMSKLKSQKSKLKLLILLTLIIGLGFSVYHLIFIRKAWDGKSRFTVISMNNGVRVESFDPRTAEGIKIVFPQNWMIAGAGGKGEWLAEKVDRADLVAENLGILYTTGQSDMSWGDRLLWWIWGRRVKWREIEGEQWMKKKRTVDGIEMWRLGESWDTAAREMLASAAVLEERLMVTVVNTTVEPGLATRMARRIENSGLRVVATQTGEKMIQGCQVRSSKQSKSKIGVRLLIRSLRCSWEAAEVGENEVELFFGQG